MRIKETIIREASEIRNTAPAFYAHVLGAKGSVIVMSHLSDAHILARNLIEQVKRIEFAKFVINSLDGDLTFDVNGDQLWNDFEVMNPELFEEN